MQESEPDASDRRARGLLVLGAVAGIVLAAVGIVRSGGRDAPLPGDAVAVVNGQPLSRDAFLRFSTAVAAERKSAELDADERQRLLERMIDEELLLQRGLALGLARFEPTARRSIVSALIASITAEAEFEEPDDAELRRFHAENPARFTPAGRVTLDVAFVSARTRPDALALEIARDMTRRLRDGEPFDAATAQADPLVASLPAGPLPLETVRSYLGPTAARHADALEVGQVGDPVRAGSGYYVLRVRERRPGELTPFENARQQVRAELLRSRGEAALRDYVEELRGSAEIRTDLPQPAAP